MIADLTILLLCQLAGEAITFWLGLPIPGPVLGLVLLACVCIARGGPPGSLGTTAPALLRHLSLLFVPAGVGIMQHIGYVSREAVPIVIAVFVSTWLTVLVTGLVFQLCARRSEPGQGS